MSDYDIIQAKDIKLLNGTVYSSLYKPFGSGYLVSFFIGGNRFIIDEMFYMKPVIIYCSMKLSRYLEWEKQDVQDLKRYYNRVPIDLTFSPVEDYTPSNIMRTKYFACEYEHFLIKNGLLI